MAFFDYEGKQIFYQLDGDSSAEILLLLNGIMMSTKSWDVFVKPFCAQLRLLRVDMLDQGQSALMTKDYTQKVQVDMLVALLDFLDIERVHLAAISYGGSIALQFAAAHQHRVNKLVLFNAVAKTSPWLKAIGEGWNAVAQSRNGVAYYHITIPFIYSPDFYNRNLAWMENRKALLVPIFSNPVFLDAMIRLTKSAESHDVEDALPTIKTKTLIVASEHDYLTPVFEQVRIRDKMPHAALLVLPDCGHASMYEKPHLFVSSILGFILENEEKYAI